ncbi:transcriptional repressor [Aerococcus sanguinicola]|uniref:Transcriptional repressor n=2 Tax=Aerococcaceae TaxID=186827 RepID=A0A109RDE6_9LACT|nr:hypothetical protein AWM72_06590 [Aerococcus sanguinicola]OFT94294.1 transcriptional repressor [Aerococcus sp. HMSC23C02]PKZ20439.1 transcriptional repressor [Aerococcus sanguinicola]
MTRPVMDNESKYAKTITALREHKVRITPQREAIIKYLIETKDHPTAEDIFNELSPHFKSMSLATVYNNLNLLTRMHLVRELNYGDDASHFDFDLDRHYHVICEHCGRIVDLYYPILYELESYAAAYTGFKVNNHRLEIYGLCQDCQLERQETEDHG